MYIHTPYSTTIGPSFPAIKVFVPKFTGQNPTLQAAHGFEGRFILMDVKREIHIISFLN
jgi:hypothetical protein